MKEFKLCFTLYLVVTINCLQSQHLEVAGNNIITPVDPTHLGSFTDDVTTVLDGAQSIYVSGNYAYVASFWDNGVEILDISDPSHPIHVGSITDDATTELDGASSIYVSGKYAYVAAGDDDGVEIIDISDPSNPLHVGSITDDATTALDGASSIYVSGKYAYVTANGDYGLEIIDISDPANPIHVGSRSGLDEATSIFVSGKYAYVTAEDDNEVVILDISDPTNPTEVGSIRDDATTALDGASSIYVSGKYAYVASRRDDGVEILDISDPANPTHVGAITDDTTTELDGAFSIYVSGKYAYVAAVDDDGVEILDISDPSNPTHAGSITDDATTALDGASSIYVSGKYAYVTSKLDDGIEILDISGLDAPVGQIGALVVSTIDINESAQVGNDLHVGGGITVGHGGVHIQDGSLSLVGSNEDHVSDMSITSQQALISLGKGRGGPHGFSFGDPIVEEGMKLVYRSASNTMRVESGSDFSQNDPLVVFELEGNVGLGIANPEAQLHTTGTVRMTHFGAGTLQTDANGNLSVSSDIRLKNYSGAYHRGLSSIIQIDPILYRWKEESGLETMGTYAGFSAQNVRDAIPEAIGIDDSGYMTLSDRPIIAALVNGVKELKAENEVLRSSLIELRKEMSLLKVSIQDAN